MPYARNNNTNNKKYNSSDSGNDDEHEIIMSIQEEGQGNGSGIISNIHLEHVCDCCVHIYSHELVTHSCV